MATLALDLHWPPSEIDNLSLSELLWWASNLSKLVKDRERERAA
jgi:hypothetical protein